MFQRVELHNHSTHSDGTLSVQELAAYAVKKNFGVLALTDHNTISGHQPLLQAIIDQNLPLHFLPGVEITTFYGHILALGMHQMIDQTLIDPNRPEELFLRLRQSGAAAVGIAHPFCIGKPVMMGCRFAMNIRNWDAVDYIEIFNTSSQESGRVSPEIAETFSGNRQALGLWETLVLSGHRIAAVTGKDLHKIPNDCDVFCTYVQLCEHSAATPPIRVIDAILRQKTIVTKGPLFCTSLQKGEIQVEFSSVDVSQPLVVEILYSTGQRQEIEISSAQTQTVTPPCNFESAVVKLYRQSCCFENLLAVGSPIYKNEREFV